MSVRKEIKRFKLILESDFRKPSDEEYKQALQDISPLIPLMSHHIIHRDNLEDNEQNMIELNKKIKEKVLQGDDEVLDFLWDSAGTLLLKNAINIITFYHR